MKYREGKRRRMDKFRIDELSSVDSPAQAGARALILKRGDDDDDVDDAEYDDDDFEKRSVVLVTSATDGHTHGIWIYSDSLGGETSYAKSEGEENGHSHPWTFTQAGAIEIGSNEGHTHTVKASAVMAAVLGQLGKHAEEFVLPAEVVAKAAEEAAQEGANVTDQEKIAKLEADLAGEKAKRERVEKVAALGAEERAHFDTLTVPAEQDAFLARSPADRIVLMKAKTDANAVVYKAEDGTEYRKSDDERLVKLARQSDQDRKVAREAIAKADQVTLEKRAETELPNLPGSPAERAVLLKAVEAIADEGERKKALEALKAGDKAMAAAFTRAGGGGANTAPADGSAEAQLDGMAKKRQAEKGVDYFTAWGQVADENPELAKRATSEGSGQQKH